MPGYTRYVATNGLLFKDKATALVLHARVPMPFPSVPVPYFLLHPTLLKSSCSPDFGVGGVSDRLGQVSPKLVFFSLGYLYAGRWHDCRQLALDVLERLPGKGARGLFVACLSRCQRVRFYF